MTQHSITKHEQYKWLTKQTAAKDTATTLESVWVVDHAELGRIALASDGSKMAVVQASGYELQKPDNVNAGSPVYDGFVNTAMLAYAKQPGRISLNVETLWVAVNRAVVMARETANNKDFGTVLLSIEPDSQTVKVRSESVDYGMVETIIDAKIDGPAMIVALSADYLLDSMDVFGTGNRMSKNYAEPKAGYPIGIERGTMTLKSGRVDTWSVDYFKSQPAKTWRLPKPRKYTFTNKRATKKVDPRLIIDYTSSHDAIVVYLDVTDSERTIILPRTVEQPRKVTLPAKQSQPAMPVDDYVYACPLCHAVVMGLSEQEYSTSVKRGACFGCDVKPAAFPIPVMVIEAVRNELTRLATMALPATTRDRSTNNPYGPDIYSMGTIPSGPTITLPATLDHEESTMPAPETTQASPTEEHAVTIEDNGYNVWVLGVNGNKALHSQLESLGLKYAAKRDGWWIRSESVNRSELDKVLAIEPAPQAVQAKARKTTSVAPSTAGDDTPAPVAQPAATITDVTPDGYGPSEPTPEPEVQPEPSTTDDDPFLAQLVEVYETIQTVKTAIEPYAGSIRRTPIHLTEHAINQWGRQDGEDALLSAITQWASVNAPYLTRDGYLKTWVQDAKYANGYSEDYPALYRWIVATYGDTGKAEELSNRERDQAIAYLVPTFLLNNYKTADIETRLTTMTARTGSLKLRIGMYRYDHPRLHDVRKDLQALEDVIADALNLDEKPRLFETMLGIGTSQDYSFPNGVVKAIHFYKNGNATIAFRKSSHAAKVGKAIAQAWRAELVVRKAGGYSENF